MSFKTVTEHFPTTADLLAALASYGCKLTPQAIYKWRESNTIPPARAPLIEAASDGALRCEQMCPSIQWIRDSSGKLTGYHKPIPVHRIS